MGFCFVFLRFCLLRERERPNRLFELRLRLESVDLIHIMAMMRGIDS